MINYFIVHHKTNQGMKYIFHRAMTRNSDQPTESDTDHDRLSDDDFQYAMHSAHLHYDLSRNNQLNVLASQEHKTKKHIEMVDSVKNQVQRSIRTRLKYSGLDPTVIAKLAEEVIRDIEVMDTGKSEDPNNPLSRPLLVVLYVEKEADVREYYTEVPNSIVKLLPRPDVCVAELDDGGEFSYVNVEQSLNNILSQGKSMYSFRTGYDEDWVFDNYVYPDDSPCQIKRSKFF
jgi:hypothetical protein